jgi:CRISPR-associated protein Cas5h
MAMEWPMVVFDLTGPQAMFRRFYTNSSSLSYVVPPRTTLVGMIAGMMGMARDTHAAWFEPERCRVAVALRSRIRTLMQTVNYIRTKVPVEFDGSEGGTQIPVEWIVPEVDESEVRYRVYLSHADVEWLREFGEMLRRQAWVYPPCLGMTECLAVARLAATDVEALLIPVGEPVTCVTAVPATAIDALLDLSEDAWLAKDRLPRLLSDDRSLIEAEEVVVDRLGRPIRAQLNRPAFGLAYHDLITGRDIEEAGVFY